MTTTTETSKKASAILPPVKLRIVSDGRPWATRVETEDGRLVANVSDIRIEYSPHQGHLIAIITVVEVPVDLIVDTPVYVWIQPT